MIFKLRDEEASWSLASHLASLLVPGCILTFRGELGSGKTSFIRAMLRALGIHSRIKSPSFSIVESYPLDCWQGAEAHHFDLYRIDDPEELDYIGFRDYFNSQSLCCIEWPEKAGGALTRADLLLELRLDEPGRLLEVNAGSLEGERLLAGLSQRS